MLYLELFHGSYKFLFSGSSATDSAREPSPSLRRRRNKCQKHVLALKYISSKKTCFILKFFQIKMDVGDNTDKRELKLYYTWQCYIYKFSDYKRQISLGSIYNVALKEITMIYSLLKICIDSFNISLEFSQILRVLQPDNPVSHM